MPEIIPNASFLLQLLIALSFIVWMVLNVVKLCGLFRKKEVTEAQVTLKSEFATKNEVKEFQKATAASLRELKETLQGIERDALDRRREIYKKIEEGANRVDSRIESLQTRIETQITGLSQLLVDVIRTK
jgi:hypothetical protein